MEITSEDQLVAESRKLADLNRQALAVLHDVSTPLGVSITAITHFREVHREIAGRFTSGNLKKSDLERFLTGSGEIAELIQLNLERAADLVRTFQKIAIDQSRRQPSIINVKAYIGGLLKALHPELKKHNHVIQLTGPEDAQIRTYPGAFGQMLTNLLVNSLEHAYGPGRNGTITIDFRIDGENLHLRYSDDGKGIPGEQMDEIFEIFHRSRPGNGASGLGLYIVHDIATRLLHGTIRCSSEEGKGTVFEITLPLDKV